MMSFFHYVSRTLKNGLQFLKEAIDQPKIVLNILTRHIESEYCMIDCTHIEHSPERSSGVDLEFQKGCLFLGLEQAHTHFC